MFTFRELSPQAMLAFGQFINPDLVPGYNIGQSFDTSPLSMNDGQWKSKNYTASRCFFVDE